MITATPESIALAAGLIGQTKGDLAQARRAAGEAFAWLQSVDPSYKPEPVKSADQRTDELRGSDGWIDPDTADLIRKLEAAERKAAECDDLLAQRNQLRADLQRSGDWLDQANRTAMESAAALGCEMADLRADLAACMESLGKVQAERDQWERTARQYSANNADLLKPIAAPQPAPQATIKANPVQAAAADPYAGLPPKMRAFLATQASKLEID